jgi:hypothetical protein
VRKRVSKKLLLRLNRVEASECGGEFVGLESEGPRAALVGDASVGVDQVDAIRPAGVLSLSRVAEFVEDRRELNPQFAHTEAGDGGAFLLVPRSGEDDFILDIALHLPDVAGVRFSYVHHEEGDVIPVLLIQLVQRGDLPAEGWSGIAAEDQHRRLLTVEGSELELSSLVDLGESKVRRRISDAKRACAGVSPKSLKWEGKKYDRAGHPGHDAAEGLGRLAHGGVDCDTRKQPHDNQRSEDFDQCRLHRFGYLGRRSETIAFRCRRSLLTRTPPQILELNGII